jgi:RNA polymerase nonessential primary-like sigma factor
MPAPQKLQRDCDALSCYMQAISRIPLLTHEEEITLGRTVQGLRRLEEIAEELKLRAGGIEPSRELWAAEAGLTPAQLQRKLRQGHRARQRMVSANLRLVFLIARKYASHQLQLEDLIQEGNLGVIKAVDRFDPSRGYKFSTYAYWWIRDGITRAICNKANSIRLPVHVSGQLSKLRQAQRELWQELGRAPSVEELAQFTGLKPLDIREILFRAQQPLSLDASWSAMDDDNLMERIRCAAPRPEEQLSRQLLTSDMEQLLHRLPPQEAELLRLRYGIDQEEPMNLSAAARAMGLTRDAARGLERRATASIQRLSERVIDYLEA